MNPATVRTKIGAVARFLIAATVAAVCLGPIGSRSQAAIEQDPNPGLEERDTELELALHGLPPFSEEGQYRRYLVSMLRNWAPDDRRHLKLRDGTDILVEQVDYRSLVDDEFAVAETESPIVEGDKDKTRSVALDLAVGFMESGLHEYVDDGRCTKYGAMLRLEQIRKRPNSTSVPKDMRELLKGGTCDGGLAYSMWQIHAKDEVGRDGIVLYPDAREWSYASYAHGKADGSQTVYARDFSDRRTAIRVSWHMLRKSIRQRKNLCGYTGEGSICPKAELRMNFASDWMRAHPFKPESNDHTYTGVE